MPYRALDHVMIGRSDPVQPGELIPASYLDSDGEEQPVDFERLLEIGAAEKVSAKEAKESG